MKIPERIIIFLAALLKTQLVFAEKPKAVPSSSTLGQIATNIQNQFGGIAYMISGAAYILGATFIIGGVFKLKAHKENHQQTHISIPFIMMTVGALFMYLPIYVQSIGGTFFTNASSFGIIGSNSLT
jgi:hypothetical protein